ncbi:MAG: anthranilate phosphoribosyltransferase [Chitinivibrionales bacterium]|nr:anthranilate phosphoribosyltransferase [Chitinivibrionales bacterium]
MTIQQAIKEVIAGANLSREQAKEVFNDIMSGNATDAQIAAFIVALRLKGETSDEIAGAAEIMRAKATHILPQKDEYVVDTCGTGGDGAHTFNISTAAALVAAGAGAKVAKHGNRSVSSKSGSADVLEALGVSLSIDSERMKTCLDEIGICFLFAPSLHTAMKHAIGPRKEIGVRTIFNILGPLTNPSLTRAQLLGVYHPDLTSTLAQVLSTMGTAKAYVVHGADGLDEISTCAPTHVAEVSCAKVISYTIEPGQFGIKKAASHNIAGGSPRQNAAIIRGILDGTQGPCRDIVVLNAGFALAAAGIAADPQQGIEQAGAAIDSGQARTKLDLLIRATQG